VVAPLGTRSAQATQSEARRRYPALFITEASRFLRPLARNGYRFRSWQIILLSVSNTSPGDVVTLQSRLFWLESRPCRGSIIQEGVGRRHIRRADMGTTMKRGDLNSMPVEELWALRSEINSVLVSKIAFEKTKLEKRLRQLESNGVSSENAKRERRPYPQVSPKYRNPAKPAETWAGRGKQPRWLTAQLRTGKKLDDFRIQPASGSARRSGGGPKALRAQGRS
jgi:DNA-binding protein H-NS